MLLTFIPLIAFISGTIAAGSDGMVLVKRQAQTTTATVTKTVFRTVTVAPTSTRMSTSSTIAAAKTTSTSTSASVQQASSTSTAVASNQSGASDSLQFAALKTHNDFRALHGKFKIHRLLRVDAGLTFIEFLGANPLNWNATLVAAAQKWANGCQFKHSGGTLGPYGENLAALSGTNTISAGIKLWNDEAKDYTPDNPNYSYAHPNLPFEAPLRIH